MPFFSQDPGLEYFDMYIFPNNSCYRGQMIKNPEKDPNAENIESYLRHGYGIQYWTDNAHYQGEWKYNKAEGKGTFWHAEGDVYSGDFKNDMANGYGEYVHLNGSKYVGDFKDDI